MINVATFDKVEFTNNMNQGKDRLHLLKLLYLAAQVREHELKELFDAAHKQVLQDNEFFVYNTYRDNSIKVGDRITDIEHEFCMSQEDQDRYFKLCSDETYKRGLTEQDGTYCKGYNGMMIKLEAENNLIDYQISLLPKALQDDFKAVKKNYIHRQKFLDIIMKGSAK